MDTFIKALQVLGPLVTVALAVFGLFVWYWQLIAKRKFEIAEQAVTEWRRANDGLTYVRNPWVKAGEGDSIKVDASFTGKARENAERHRFTYERLGHVQDTFKDVRLTQILVDLHISSQAARTFDVLFRVRHLVQVDADALIEDFSEQFATPEQMLENQQRRNDYRRGIAEKRNKDGKPDPSDVYSRVLDEASEVLESECRQILRPKTIVEFLFSRRTKPAIHEWSDEAKKLLGRR